MRRMRPAWLAIGGVVLWALQLVATAIAFHGTLPASGRTLHWAEWTAIGAALALGALLLLQVPRALRWRPRRSQRPSAELLAERRRIAQDLHDHLGSQLVCAMALLDKAQPHECEVLAVLERCMLDLRLVVDSMDGADDPFADRLARLKHRIHPVMERRGIRMSWDLQIPEPCTQLLSAHGAAQLIAIVQEALSNVLQHSRATEVAVGVQFIADMGHWVMEISDNGGGVSRSPPSDAPPAGHGVEGMRRRARMAGGQMQVEPRQGGGTCIRVVVPGAAPLPSSSESPTTPGRPPEFRQGLP